MNKLDYQGNSPLQKAYDYNKFETMKVLITCGADPNLLMRNGQTLLYHACKNDKYKHAEVLLQNGANEDIQTTCEWGYTPLHWAAEKGYNDIIRLLRKPNALMNKLDKKGYSALERAYNKDKFETMKVLINCGADPNILMSDNETLLHHACKRNKYKQAEVLLQNGANVNIKGRDEWGYTPLHWVAQKGYSDIIRLLRKHNALMNKLDKKGCSALKRAYDNDKFEALKVLISCGANPNIFMSNDETLLHHACEFNKYKHAKVLLENGANVNIKGRNEWGYTPLHWAAQKGHSDIIRLLRKHNALMNKLDKKGCSALERAYDSNKFITMGVLINCWADPNIFIKSKETLLHYSCRHGKYEHAEVLLENGANVNIQTECEWGYTPLHYAAQKGNIAIIKLLKKYKANFSKRDKKKCYAFNRAKNSNTKELIKEYTKFRFCCFFE